MRRQITGNSNITCKVWKRWHYSTMNVININTDRVHRGVSHYSTMNVIKININRVHKGVSYYSTMNGININR